MASPRPVPVSLATHDAAERWPSVFQASDCATRAPRSTCPAEARRFSSAKSPKSSAAWAVVIRSGSSPATYADSSFTTRLGTSNGTTCERYQKAMTVTQGHGPTKRFIMELVWV